MKIAEGDAFSFPAFRHLLLSLALTGIVNINRNFVVTRSSVLLTVYQLCKENIYLFFAIFHILTKSSGNGMT